MGLVKSRDVVKINDLGEILIPENIRVSLGISKNDEFDIILKDTGHRQEITVIPHQPLRTIQNLLVEYADILAVTTDTHCCVYDTKNVIAINRDMCESRTGNEITPELIDIMTQKETKTIVCDDKSVISVTPIYLLGKHIGLITLESNTGDISEGNIKLVNHTSKLITKQLEFEKDRVTQEIKPK